MLLTLVCSQATRADFSVATVGQAGCVGDRCASTDHAEGTWEDNGELDIYVQDFALGN